MDTKQCSKCKSMLALSEYYKDNRKESVSGLKAACKKCDALSNKEYRKNHVSEYNIYRAQWTKLNPEKRYAQGRRRRLKKEYGLTETEYQIKEEAQGGMCAICKKIPTRKLHVDHNHQTSKIRGLLCYPCNAGLGYFYDNPELLDKAISYLHKYEDNKEGNTDENRGAQ